MSDGHTLILDDEHDACGVGAIVDLTGSPRRSIVEHGLTALKNLMHRGAVDADGKTGDGAGIHVEISAGFFHPLAARFGRFDAAQHRLAVAMVFLPRKSLDEQESCRTTMESELAGAGLSMLGWRQVPINTAVLGQKAADVRPEIEQLFIAAPLHEPLETLERRLYHVRRRIEKRMLSSGNREFYICSLSARSVIYKGMMLADQLAAFYPDLAAPSFTSRFALFHQRYSTNTFPTWRLAHPFRVIAHNGEINTLKGNVAWMQAHEARFSSPHFSAAVLDDIRPLIQPGNSDSASLDNVLELLTHGGKPLPLAKTLLIPEAWRDDTTIPPALKALYEINNSVIEPWDGPAAVVGYDGTWILAGMDRSGLRPCRYSRTADTLVIGSEAGLVPLPVESILAQGRLAPGQMLGVNLTENKLYDDAALKDWLCQQSPPQVPQRLRLLDSNVAETPVFSPEALRTRQIAAGWSMEELELLLHPMAAEGKEAIGSMGDDSPLAVLNSRFKGLHHFMRQNFAQVTNPPLDSIRERRVMSLKTRLGNLQNLLADTADTAPVWEFDTPILLPHELAQLKAALGGDMVTLAATYTPTETTLEKAVDALCVAALSAIEGGARAVLLTDTAEDANTVSMPMLLAVSALNSFLIRKRRRAHAALLVESAECLEPHHTAMLIACGATTVTPYLAAASITARHAQGLLPGLTLEAALKQYQKALADGLLKIMAKLGISVVASYRGGYNFEAIGLSRALMDKYFPSVPSRLSGLGIEALASRKEALHREAYSQNPTVLPIGGFYRVRAGQEAHAYDGGIVHLLQTAVTENDPALFRQYVDKLHSRPPIQVRDLLEVTEAAQPMPVEEVEPVTSIRQRFVTPGMSLGALSPEAHGTLNIAMNRIGAKSDSGEGGEIRDRYTRLPNGDSANSAIKQIASARFGVTSEYLNQARELEIKVAQGAKPGEGGQLPGFKVTELIARLRHATPGVMLISPPPHHDIYSIEDLAQLIYDLKQAAPRARVGVKLVARSGIGTIAAGVAKAKADVILISGHNGGTGASPQSSIKHAGIPWEIGLAEVHQTLLLNDLRRNVVLRADGGLKSGRDIIVAALLGAEEYGIGTAALVAMGCLMVRQCHSNTCPVGICTQDETLREKFGGSAEKVINLMTFIAEDVRRCLSLMGARTLDEIIGRADFLGWRSGLAAGLHGLDLNPVLAEIPADAGKRGAPWREKTQARIEVEDTLDAQILKDTTDSFAQGASKRTLTYSISTRHRSVGARLSAHITEKFGMSALPDDQFVINLEGSAGQSFGVFTCKGVTLSLSGIANDYVGKGLCGGIIAVRPPRQGNLVAGQSHALIGNTCLYGATGGELYAAGAAGERFAVRNSGAVTVVEGCGANGCEYMTGGVAVILGAVGHNFAAGMTGGRAYVYDPDARLLDYLNAESVSVEPFDAAATDELRGLLAAHILRTGSEVADGILQRWETEKKAFRLLIPKEILALNSATIEDKLKVGK